MSISEKAVEAAAAVIAEASMTGSIIEKPNLPTPCWMGLARAALEAALPLHQHPDDREPVEAVKAAYAYLRANAVKYGDGPTVYNEHGKMIDELLDYVKRLRGVIREANMRLRPADSGSMGVSSDG